MEDYREAQRQKWLAAQSGKQADPASTSGVGAGTGAAAAGAAVPSSSGAAPATADASAPDRSGSASADSPSTSSPRPARRVHVLPVGPDPVSGGDAQGRLGVLAPELRRKRDAKDIIKNGLFIRSGSYEFIVVKVEPEDSFLTIETDYFVEGEPLKRFEKVHFICLWDFESGSGREDTSSLFSDYISPHFRRICNSGEERASILTVGEVLRVRDRDFQVMASEPQADIGIMDQNTLVYVDWDLTPEFDKIHIVPFQDTLPNAYEFDIFNDYLKPYLTRNKHTSFNVNDSFRYQGVQFKVVCCEPAGPARIGRNTTIYCEGVLHPSLRNLLPPDLLEQLSNLPPGLQMLLLNTDALAGGYEERIIEVQEMLSRRRGLSQTTIDHIEQFRWGDRARAAGDDSQSQCMVCLCDFGSDEQVKRLPCGHLFHGSCIDEWLRRCTDCPICKASVDRNLRN